MLSPEAIASPLRGMCSLTCQTTCSKLFISSSKQCPCYSNLQAFPIAFWHVHDQASKTPRAVALKSPAKEVAKSPRAGSAKSPKADTAQGPAEEAAKSPKATALKSPKADGSSGPAKVETKGAKGKTGRKPRGKASAKRMVAEIDAQDTGWAIC